MALSEHHVQRMEVDRFSFVALWKPYVALRTHRANITDGSFDLIAGSGKTVIWSVVTDRSHHVKLTQLNSSTIIEDIMALHDAGRASIAYFYFDFRDTNKRSCQDLLHSLLIQLSAQSNHSFDTLSRLHSKHDHGTRPPSDDAMVECLKEMLASADQNSTYIVIDALDECPHTSGITSPREHVLNLLKKLVELGLPSLHVCVTSRPEIDIRLILESLTQNCLSLHSENGQMEDILSYIKFVVEEDDAMRRWKEEDKILVIETLSENEGGM
jgi:hypothetical protein